MAKAVMMSIQPKWVEKILNGEQTIVVRKTVPKEVSNSFTIDVTNGDSWYDTPFKVYIYCTKGDRPLVYHDVDKRYIMSKWSGNSEMMLRNPLNGKVVAEFTCDRIYDIVPIIEFSTGNCVQYEFRGCQNGTANHCLSFKELDTYLQSKDGYAWHISNLKIYDKPRELSEFKPYNRKECYFSDLGLAKPKCENCHECKVTRPFQSWGYVEE